MTTSHAHPQVKYAPPSHTCPPAMHASLPCMPPMLASGGTHAAGMLTCNCRQLLLRKGNVFTSICHSVHSGGRCTPPGRHLPPTQADPTRQTPPRTDTPHLRRPAVDGTHPTGMHSCFILNSSTSIIPMLKAQLQ